MRASASDPLSISAAVQSRACASASVCASRAQGKGNEDRWGSFKQPGFTSREASYSANAPMSRGKSRAAPALPSLIISSLTTDRESDTCLETHTLTPYTWRPTKPRNPKNGTLLHSCDWLKNPLAPYCFPTSTSKHLDVSCLYL